MLFHRFQWANQFSLEFELVHGLSLANALAHCYGVFTYSRRANEVWGFIAGVLTFTPYQHWRWEHAVHHSSSGDLESLR